MKPKIVVSLLIAFPSYCYGITISAPIGVGELIDKITILEIKETIIKDPSKHKNVLLELHSLETILKREITESLQLNELKQELMITNKKLWDIEDALRAKEAEKLFDNEFIELARSVYLTNDHRAALKRIINIMTESAIIEEKEHTEYQ